MTMIIIDRPEVKTDCQIVPYLMMENALRKTPRPTAEAKVMPFLDPRAKTTLYERTMKAVVSLVGARSIGISLVPG